VNETRLTVLRVAVRREYAELVRRWLSR